MTKGAGGTGLADELTAEDKAYLEQAHKEAYSDGNADETSPAGAETLSESTSNRTEAPTAARSGWPDDPVETGEGAAADDRGRYARHRAVDAARERREADEGELARLRVQIAHSDARAAAFNRLLHAAQAAPPSRPMPDPRQDFSGAFNWAAERINALEGHMASSAQAAEAQVAEQLLRNRYVADAREFLTRQADFLDAYHFFIQHRDAELAAGGVADPEERARMFNKDEQTIVLRALQRGDSPAERVYALAKARGYAPGNARGRGTAGRIENIQRGRAATRSLSTIGGSAGAGLPTKEELAEMSEHEFEKAVKGLTRQQFEDIMCAE